MSDKTNAELLQEKLCYKPESGLNNAEDKEIKASYDFCEGYKQFLNTAKTEREAVIAAIIEAEQNGFKPFNRNEKYKAGDKVYFNNHGKALALAVIGKENIENGINITAAHIDSPRLDLKQNPLYEDIDLALFKTHYYGGIKKYQWTAIPLALHGVFAKTDGSVISVSIGESDDEPKFVINDLLPHLSSEQYKRTLNEGIKGEELNILVGSMPFKDDKISQKVKLNILRMFYEKYGVTEQDFVSAELEAVPAFKACDIGLDKSFVGGYGQDDRVCAYSMLKATLKVSNPEKTCLAIFADKEEIGSEGYTGLNSEFVKFTVYDLCNSLKADTTVTLRNSRALSADVNAAVDPTFKDVSEFANSSFVNRGVVVTKYTGARGKSSTSDAHAEYMGYIRGLLNAAKVTWQIGELGKVDMGGGGTVAKYVASLGIDTVDLGVPVLSMHAPFETTAKFDVYMCYKAIYEFMK